MEEWRDIPSYNYEVSNQGKIRNTETGLILKQHIGTTGYYILHLTEKCKPKIFKVHRIVAQVFIPNPDNLPQVNHKNLNKLDNRIENLEWVTRKQNNRHAADNGRYSSTIYKKGNLPHTTKLNKTKAIKIRKL